MHEYMIEYFVRLTAAMLLGGLIGLERQIHGQTAGFRTQSLVSLGSCLFTLMSLYLYEQYGKVADPGRIAAQIVVGIGFIGAGSILRHKSDIRGLTTAATLWAVSAIGMTVGFGRFFLAVFSTLIVLITLTLFKYFERIIPQERYSNLIIRIKGDRDIDLEQMTSACKIKIIQQKFDVEKEKSVIEHQLVIRYKDPKQFVKLLKTIKEIPELSELSVS